MSEHRHGRYERSKVKYSYVLAYEDGQWSAHYPDLHCWGVGRTRAQAVTDLKEAAALMADYLKDTGQPLPRPSRIEVGASAF